MSDFGEQLRNLRSRFGLTQAALAEASNLGQSTISALETGRQGPWPSTRRALARAFRISLEEFDAQMMGAQPAGGDSPPALVDQAGRVDLANLARGQGPPPSGESGGGRTWAIAPLPASAPSEFRFAPTKVMELLNQLGQAEHQLRQYRAFLNDVCAACWTTDASLHLTSSFGAAAADQRRQHGAFEGRHISEFFEQAWGQDRPDFLPLVMQQKAADGHSVGFFWALEGARYMVFIDPVRDAAGKVVGTVGLAIDLTERELVTDHPI